MSDKSFGDHANRNIVKNPLLSTAVTGLSIEDLTHNAVLVPVAPNQGLITRSDHQIGSHDLTLANPDNDLPTFPSGDSNSNIFSPHPSFSTYSHSLEQHTFLHDDKKPEITSSTVSKAPMKSDDDFDVNEYFARLQGTRYVSAPLNSHQDPNTNLVATEENLEEINLNDDKNIEVQQSLTADIAQNFSQLPTVLPHVASAVFSSFSNMLNLKSREQTPDDRAVVQDYQSSVHGYQDVQFQSSQIPSGVPRDVPLMGTEDVVKEVAPPPKEPPVSGTSNYRLTTKKKYAQIPGLSSGETVQKIAFNPLTQNVPPSFFLPTADDSKIIPEPTAVYAQGDVKTADFNPPDIKDTYKVFNPVDTNVAASHFQPIDFGVPKESEPKFFEDKPPTSILQSQTPVIPPPPMFSAQRKDSHTGKSVLPPSVARRLGSNQPVIKPQVMQSTLTDNIFVPTFDSTPTNIPPTLEPNLPPSINSSQPGIGVQMFAPPPQTQESSSLPSINKPNIPPLPIPPASTELASQTFAAPSKPISNIPSGFPEKMPPLNPPVTIAAPPMFAPIQPQVSETTPSIFVPTNIPMETVSNIGADLSLPPSSSIFSHPSTISQPLTAGPPQASIGSNIGQATSIFSPPPPGNASSSFYNPTVGAKPMQAPAVEPPKPLIEPPKAIGGVNYRMNKKRPQYYSGPIEGVGAISNSIKPVIPSADSTTFQGALFTPEQPNVEQTSSSVPFDISKVPETSPSYPQYNVVNPTLDTSSVPFDINQQASYQPFDINTQSQSSDQQYNTAFDLSRPTTDSYDYSQESKQSIGFGIIGSLKSKLSGLDINKIQNSVTTFFDPTYNDTKKDVASEQNNVPYNPAQQVPNTFQIFVPGVENNPQSNYQANQKTYYDQNQYYQNQYSYQSQDQNFGGYYSNPPTYSGFSHVPVETQQTYAESSTASSLFQPPPVDTHLQNIKKEEEPINSVAAPEEIIPTPPSNQELFASVETDEDVTQLESKVTKTALNIAPTYETSPRQFFDMASSSSQSIHTQEQSIFNLTTNPDAISTQIGLESTIKPIGNVIEPPKMDSRRSSEAKPVDLFSQTQELKDGNIKTADISTETFISKQDEIPTYPAQNVDLFAKADSQAPVETANKNPVQFFSNIPDGNKEKPVHEPNLSLFSSTNLETKVKPEGIIKGDNLLESLSKDDVPILGVSSVPLFGLSTILADKSKEYEDDVQKTTKFSLQSVPKNVSILDRNASMSFFEHMGSGDQKIDYGTPKPLDVSSRNSSMSFFENLGATIQNVDDYNNVKNTDVIVDRNLNTKFFDNANPLVQNFEEILSDNTGILERTRGTSFFEQMGATIERFDGLDILDDDKELEKEPGLEYLENIDTDSQEDTENVSELNICATCREVDKPEDRDFEDHDVTTQMIENITSPIQLSNPVEAPLPVATNTDMVEFDPAQCEEITHITEETIETIQVQSATELLYDVDEIKPMGFGWSTDQTYSTSNIGNDDYSFKIDPNTIGFFGNNSLFFDNVPTNASDELKAEFKHQDHQPFLPRQMSIPSAPPAEEDAKSDEAGVLDVHSIEQDAKKDFPIFEEFVIEPSETDDDKIEYKERERADSDTSEVDSFTNRVEKFKKMEEVADVEEHKSVIFELPSQPISMASYFDTGNYAADTHYRNSMTSPSQISIPPGFEEEYKKRLALAKLQENMHKVPETSTQTRPIVTLSYSTAQNSSKSIYSIPQNITPALIGTRGIVPVGFDVEDNVTHIVEDNTDSLPAFSTVFGAKESDNKDKESPVFPVISESKEFAKAFSENPLDTQELPPFLTLDDKPKPAISDLSSIFPSQSEDKNTISFPKTEDVKQKLPDPINFFSDNTPVAAPDNFSRLASYFNSPPKTDHAKSFFELSQSQNHYRHASRPIDDKYASLMKDLTSVQNIEVSKDQVIRHVNYFTVEYDHPVTEFNKGDAKLDNDKTGEYDVEKVDLNEVVSKCSVCLKVLDKNFKVRKAVNGNSEEGSPNNNMDAKQNAVRTSVSIDFDGLPARDDASEELAGLTESRSNTEYSPVKHHWFYRVDVEDKSIWRGFSVTDSRALETKYLSPDLTESTLVPTDGGRFDVNVVGRLRIPVYWSEKPTNVRRCSWFYKGTTDARYVPYTEPVAEQLEEEYRHGMTTGEWHRRLMLPNGEVVVMHGATVMVHFLHSDAFSTPPQSSSRPRVVRRGHDETEIEDIEPSSIDHLLLLCHGVGSACDMRFRSVEEVVEDFRATSLQLLQSHYRNSYDQGIVSRVEVLPISWHATLHSGETGVDRRLAQITLDSIPRLRSFTNDTVLDVLFYTSPIFCQTIVDTVCRELNRIYGLFMDRNPEFKGGVSLGGHSLGSVILYDLLCHQEASILSASATAEKAYLSGSAGTGQPTVRYPVLTFKPHALYALGSPIAMFECIRGVESLGPNFCLPTCKNFFNIFHPYDPIAYRIEPLVNPRLRDLKPFLIPHHKGRKRMHLELKDTMARVGADLKQKLMESLRSTWNKWKASPPTDGQLEKVVEEEIEKDNLYDESKDELARETELSTPDMLGRLNGGRRVDYVLQEAPLEMINEYLFAMSSHVGYWESEDTMLLMLREIYSALGVQPDCTVPQQSMTVQRTKKQDETIIVTECPSTSHGMI